MSGNYNILVINNDKEDRKRIRQLLSKTAQNHFEIKELFDASSAIKYCQDNPQDCILVDYTLPDMNGIEFIKTIHQKLPNYPHNIIMLANQGNDEVAALAIQSGAKGYISKQNLSTSHLDHKINDSIKLSKQQQKKVAKDQKLHKLIEYDPLTKLPNAKAFNKKISQSFNAAKRYNRISALLLFDLDKFHLINDSIGYDKTDQLLKLIAQRVNNNIRVSDFAARIEENQFAIILDEVEQPDNAVIAADKLIEQINLPYNISDLAIRISTNVGLCCFPQQFSLPSEVINRAKVAMFYDKQNLTQSLWYYPNSKN